MFESLRLVVNLYHKRALEYHLNENDDNLEYLRSIKGELAQLLKNPSVLSQMIAYLDELSQIANGPDKLLKYAINAPDSTTTHPTKREPNSIEAIVATIEAQDNYNDFLHQLQHVGPIIPIGSLTSSAYYWLTHSSGMKRPSDIDFEVIIDPKIILELPNILDTWGSEQEDFNNFCLEFNKHYHEGNADFGTYRREVPERNLWIDCHLVPEKTLKRICDIDLTTIKQTTTLKEFRLHDRILGHSYKQRRLNGEIFTYDASYHFNALETNKGVIFDVPHVLYDAETDQIGMGYPLDKYLSVCIQPVLYDNTGSVTKQVNILANSVAKRLAYERHMRPNEQLSLSNALVNSVRMNPHYKQDLNHYIESLI